ncbi:MAG: S41 family peptidase [Chloroflexota bacterium]|nr:S41 family peptidase [Chloroflexota bacterium]MDE2970509.1 S41 family peptidase [Chloroflexota bacterium]
MLRALLALLAVVAVTVACSRLPIGDVPPTLAEEIAAEAAALEPGQVPVLALSPVGDIWTILSTRHVDRDDIDPAALAEGAVDRLIVAADRLELFDETIPAAAVPRPESLPEEFAPLWDAWSAVYAADAGDAPPDPVALSRTAMRGIVDALDDPHSAYVPPQEFALEDLEFTGSYQGVGAEVHAHEDTFTLTPMPDSPAEKAGLRPGDRLLTVDGVSVVGWTTLDVVSKVRGPSDTVVVLGVIHEGETAAVEISITRGPINLQSVTWQSTPSGHAYVRLSGFYANTDEALEDVLKEIIEADAHGLILDVRNNPGGLLSTTVNIASMFLDGGLVVYELDGAGERREWNAKDGGVAKDLPLILLVNQHSASAGEVLAGALQDRDRATVVGVRTFGKGSVNQLAPLSDGGGLYYSYGRWYTPNGCLIEGSGLGPDVEVERGPIQRDEQMLHALDLIAEIAPAPSG